MTTAQSQITTRPEPETVNSRFVVVPPRPSCRPDSSTIASAAVEPPGSRIENPESSSLIQQSSNPVIQPTQRKLTRNGKVARLTHLQRDMVNRMLRNNLS